MDDSIRRQDAIEEIAESLWHYPNALYPAFNEFDNCIDFVKDVVKRIPPANSWIPCSEKLPEMECNVLIWTRTGHYEVAHLDIQEWTEDTLIWYPQYNRLGDGVEWYMEGVLAWQPLPAPWGRRKDEQRTSC